MFCLLQRAGALATALTAAVCAAAAPVDFEVRWQSALAELAVLPPDALSVQFEGTITFPVTATARAVGRWFPGTDGSATPVVHVVETLDDLRPPDRARSHLYLPAGDGLPPGVWLSAVRPDARHGPASSVLAVCQAINLVRSRPAATASRVGLVGDGFGAQIALAAAALSSDRVAWLVLHQPAPALYHRPDGTLTACPGVRAALTRPDTSRAFDYIDPLSFAPMVRCPVFVIAGADDHLTPLAEVEILFANFTCPRDARVIHGLGHCPSAQLRDLATILARMDAFARSWRTARLTAP